MGSDETGRDDLTHGNRELVGPSYASVLLWFDESVAPAQKSLDNTSVLADCQRIDRLAQHPTDL